MIGTVALGYHAGVTCLVIFLTREADGECLYWAGRILRHQCDDSGGINSARKECNQRNVRYETQSDRFSKAFDKFNLEIFSVAEPRRGPWTGQRPIRSWRCNIPAGGGLL